MFKMSVNVKISSISILLFLYEPFIYFAFGIICKQL